MPLTLLADGAMRRARCRQPPRRHAAARFDDAAMML